MKTFNVILIVFAFSIFYGCGSSEDTAKANFREYFRQPIDTMNLENLKKLLSTIEEKEGRFEADTLFSDSIRAFKVDVLFKRIADKQEELYLEQKAKTLKIIESNISDLSSWGNLLKEAKAESLLEVAVFVAKVKLEDRKKAMDIDFQDRFMADGDIQKAQAKYETAFDKNFLKYGSAIRKHYAKILARAYWEADVEVASYGSQNTIIEFRGNAILPNEGKKTIVDKHWSDFLSLRFKQVRFRWFKGYDEYTYFDVK